MKNEKTRNEEQEMKNYYGFEYADGVNTTSGQPNTNPGKFNGYYNTAGELKLFASKSARDEWVERGCRNTLE